jgi:hypothetical protein
MLKNNREGRSEKLFLISILLKFNCMSDIYVIGHSRLGAEIQGRSGNWNHKIILFWPNLA